MNVRLAAVFGSALIVSSLASAQCMYFWSEPCDWHEDNFGYYQNTSGCADQTCDDDGEGNLECPGDDVYNYTANDTDVYAEDGSTGYDSLSWTTGATCVQKRSCEDCQTPIPFAPPPGCLFASGSSWTDFLWGSTISGSGTCDESEW